MSKALENYKYADIDDGSSGDNTIVAAKPGVKFRVICGFMISAGTVNARWKSGASTNLTGDTNLVANSGYTLPQASCGWFETDYGDALVLNLSGAIGVDGAITYQEIERNQTV